MSALAPLGPVVMPLSPLSGGGEAGSTATPNAIAPLASASSGAKADTSTGQGAGGRESEQRSSRNRDEPGEYRAPPPPAPLKERAAIPDRLTRKLAEDRAEAQAAAEEATAEEATISKAKEDSDLAAREYEAAATLQRSETEESAQQVRLDVSEARADQVETDIAQAKVVEAKRVTEAAAEDIGFARDIEDAERADAAIERSVLDGIQRKMAIDAASYSNALERDLLDKIADEERAMDPPPQLDPSSQPTNPAEAIAAFRAESTGDDSGQPLALMQALAAGTANGVGEDGSIGSARNRPGILADALTDQLAQAVNSAAEAFGPANPRALDLQR